MQFFVCRAFNVGVVSRSSRVLSDEVDDFFRCGNVRLAEGSESPPGPCPVESSDQGPGLLKMR